MSIYLPCLPNSSWSFSQPTSNFETYKSTINLKLGGFNQPFSTIFDAWISMVLRSPTTNENRHGEFSAGFCRRPMGWCRPAVGSGFWMDSWRSREYATEPTEKTDIYYTWVSHVVHRTSEIEWKPEEPDGTGHFIWVEKTIFQKMFQCQINLPLEGHLRVIHKYGVHIHLSI